MCGNFGFAHLCAILSPWARPAWPWTHAAHPFTSAPWHLHSTLPPVAPLVIGPVARLGPAFCRLPNLSRSADIFDLVLFRAAQQISLIWCCTVCRGCGPAPCGPRSSAAETRAGGSCPAAEGKGGRKLPRYCRLDGRRRWGVLAAEEMQEGQCTEWLQEQELSSPTLKSQRGCFTLMTH